MNSNSKEHVILGVGSVGLSTMAFINENSGLPSGSKLFVKPDFEETQKEGSVNSASAQKKYTSLMSLQKLGIVKSFENSFELPSKVSALFTISGLGGNSGDFLAKMSFLETKRLRKVISFCIMPFAFEGAKRGNKAESQLGYIQSKQVECIVLRNQDLLKTKDNSARFEDAFKFFHKHIEEEILAVNECAQN